MKHELHRRRPLPTTRRQLLLAGASVLVLPRPLCAAVPTLAQAIRDYTGGALPRPGKVILDIAPLVENGNTVPITVQVDSPMTPSDHVVAVAVFNERNPQRDVVKARFGPRSGRARFSTRIRLATSQQVVAVAALGDGSFWSHSVDVIVTLAACVE
jgi:sulfur-oxidizing protein SoxY